MGAFTKKADSVLTESFSDHEVSLDYFDTQNGRYAHSLFDPLLNGVQTSFFTKNHQVDNAAISTATSPYSTTLFPQISIGPNVVEANDAPAVLGPSYALAVGQSARGEITVKGDHDYYSISLVSGQTYTFAQIGTGVKGLQDPFLALINSSGKTVASNDDGGPGASSLFTYKALATGTYYINAGAYGNVGTGEYGLSVTAGTKASFNIEMGAGALDSFKSWTSLDVLPSSPVEITYGFRSSAPTSYAAPANFSQLSSGEITAVNNILSLWSDVANIKFKQILGIDNSQYTNSATIEIANYSANDGAGAFAYYPDVAEYGGDLWLNLSGGVTTSGVTAGSYAFFAIMHELGHALGLSHPGDYNAGAGKTITYSGNAQFIQDTEMYSVMSYFGGSYTGETPGGFATAYTPMLLDVYEIQQLYGANNATRTGDSTYGFRATDDTKLSYSMASNVVPQFCIWDGGGTDTLDCSGSSASQNISLIAGTFSSVDGGKNNVSIALNCVVENAIGGTGNDTIVANAAVNQLTGGAGADIFKYFSAADSNSLAIDWITDFVSGVDKLDLSVLDANTINTGKQAFTFINGGFTGSAGELRFDSTTQQVQADTNGDKVADFAVLIGVNAVATGDLIL